MGDAKRTVAALKQISSHVPRHRKKNKSDGDVNGDNGDDYDPSALAEEVDLEKYPTAKQLVQRCRDFFKEVQDLTPGKDLEAFLNAGYGPGTPIYEDFCALVKQGLHEGWLANIEIDGQKYRRSKISLPSAENKFFSITAVYMESVDPYRGQYHTHPYGEINCVIQIDPTAELKGMSGWQGPGWTSPGAGTHHYPEVRGGALVALFFLPAGRIAYAGKTEDDAQPIAV